MCSDNGGDYSHGDNYTSPPLLQAQCWLCPNRISHQASKLAPDEETSPPTTEIPGKQQKTKNTKTKNKPTMGLRETLYYTYLPQLLAPGAQPPHPSR